MQQVHVEEAFLDQVTQVVPETIATALLECNLEVLTMVGQGCAELSGRLDALLQDYGLGSMPYLPTIATAAGP